MEEFGVSKQSQDKIPDNPPKRKPSDLDLLFCFECDETFASKSEENRHRCGGDPNVEAIGIDDEDSIDVSSSNVEDKKGKNRDIIKKIISGLILADFFVLYGASFTSISESIFATLN